MSAAAAEHKIATCPSTGEDCTCSVGPVYQEGAMEINGDRWPTLFKKCGALPVKESTQQRIIRLMYEYTPDD